MQTAFPISRTTESLKDKELEKADFKIINKFNFTIKPVAVKFLVKKPDAVPRLNHQMALCEMLKKAQEGEGFFAGADNHTCEAGLYVLGQKDISGPFLNGEFGAGLKIFDSTRTASRLYQHIPKIEKGAVKYIAFSSIDDLAFDPDLLIFMADTSQTEILLRAMSFRTGHMWHSRFTPAIGCAWIIIHPYLSGELNYSIAGLGHGMKRRGLFPEGKQIISIPFDLLPGILESLQNMPWVLPAYEPDGKQYVKKIMDTLDLSQ